MNEYMKEHFRKSFADINFDELVRSSKEAVIARRNGTFAFDPEIVCSDGMTPEERLEWYKKNGIKGSFDYPGGFSQFEKDVKSGEYGKRGRFDS